MDTSSEDSLNAEKRELITLSYRAEFNALGNGRIEVVLADGNLNELCGVTHLALLGGAKVDERFAKLSSEVGRE